MGSGWRKFEKKRLLEREKMKNLQELEEDLELEKVKIRQNQQRLDNIEMLLNSEYCNEKLKIKQNQERLDRIEEKLLMNESLENEIKRVINEFQLIKEKNEFLFENTDKDFWDKRTVSQSGEDSIIAYVFLILGIDLKSEYYLDLGANHAKQLSNTYMLYQQGMRGVLVEANPKLIGELKFYRNEDIVLNKCISDTSGEKVHFYVLSGDGLSTSDLDVVNEIIKINPLISVEKEIVVDTITVDDILKKYFGKAPLLVNIDIEGQELNILKSIELKTYRPLLFIVEMIEYSNKIAVGKKNTEILEFMESVGYKEYAFTGINSIFIDTIALKEKWGYDL